MVENPAQQYPDETIRQAASESVRAGDDIRQRVHDLMLEALKARRFDRQGIREVVRAVSEGVALGAGEVRVMAVDREGTREGMDVDLLRLLRGAVGVPIVLEGGAGTLAHVRDAYEAGADGVALGTMLVFSDNNLVKIKRYLAGRGCRVRV